MDDLLAPLLADALTQAAELPALDAVRAEVWASDLIALADELGDDVEGLAVGDHVALSWIPYCGTCRECSGGATHLCGTYLDALWSGTDSASGEGGQVAVEDVQHDSPGRCYRA